MNLQTRPGIPGLVSFAAISDANCPSNSSASAKTLHAQDSPEIPHSDNPVMKTSVALPGTPAMLLPCEFWWWKTN